MIADGDGVATGDSVHRIIRVGWLNQGTPFPTGNTANDVFEKLCELVQDPWGPPGAPVTVGVHFCNLAQYGGKGVNDWGCGIANSKSVYIPDEGFIYEVPRCLPHYINVHWYQPSGAFCAAVLNCPPMRSHAYLQALLANGGRDLFERSTNNPCWG